MRGSSRVKAQVHQIRRAIEGLGRRGRTERIPQAIRERVVRVVEEARVAGMSWRELAAEIGLAATTIERWSAISHRTSGALVRVRVGGESSAGKQSSERAGLTVVSANGFRLEGLSVAEALSVMRALG